MFGLDHRPMRIEPRTVFPLRPADQGEDGHEGAPGRLILDAHGDLRPLDGLVAVRPPRTVPRPGQVRPGALPRPGVLDDVPEADPWKRGGLWTGEGLGPAHLTQLPPPGAVRPKGDPERDQETHEKRRKAAEKRLQDMGVDLDRFWS